MANTRTVTVVGLDLRILTVELKPKHFPRPWKAGLNLVRQLYCAIEKEWGVRQADQNLFRVMGSVCESLTQLAIETPDAGESDFLYDGETLHLLVEMPFETPEDQVLWAQYSAREQYRVGWMGSTCGAQLSLVYGRTEATAGMGRLWKFLFVDSCRSVYGSITCSPEDMVGLMKHELVYDSDAHVEHVKSLQVGDRVSFLWGNHIRSGSVDGAESHSGVHYTNIRDCSVYEVAPEFILGRSSSPKV